MNNISINNSPVFTSRKAVIRDANWVCHKINANLSHCSTTKHIPTYKKLIMENPNFVKNSPMPESMKSLLQFIKLLTEQPLKPYQLESNSLKQNVNLLNYSKHIIPNLGRVRNLAEYKYGPKTIQSVIYQLSEFKLGNCYENAKVAEFILLLNGIENACLAKLYNNNKPIDHIVCLFNKDGSSFNGKINNSTIVIDNWAGKTDYAKNMCSYYKNLYKDYFYIPANSFIDYKEFEKLNLSSKEICKLKEKYPNFLFQAKRKFMSEK